MAPPARGRRIQIASNPPKRQWLIVIGPDITLADMKERERLARGDERVLTLQQEHDELIARAAALEVEAKALRDDARFVHREVGAQVRQIVGPVKPLTESYDFQCENEAIDAEIAAASDDDRVDRLLSAQRSGRTAEGNQPRLLGRDSCRLRKSLPVQALGRASARKNGSMSSSRAGGGGAALARS